MASSKELFDRDESFTKAGKDGDRSRIENAVDAEVRSLFFSISDSCFDTGISSRNSKHPPWSCHRGVYFAREHGRVTIGEAIKLDRCKPQYTQTTFSFFDRARLFASVRQWAGVWYGLCKFNC
ncbi:hypothetical protein [Nitrosomonas sp.]|uniref:hypothetical protein n=1 Tax=Nitrosomonas sp. TaxID=42353 RepID=UPI002AC8A9E9|nr:hypothetical protein [Nitrosomonas sp.]